MNRVAIGAAIVCVAPATVGMSSQLPPELVRPNVLVIVLDDVGVEKLSVFGAPLPPPLTVPPTPPSTQPPTINLTTIASGGVRFTKVYANPVCSPSRATLMTGRHAFRTGMNSNPDTETGAPVYPLPLSEITIAEVLRDGFPMEGTHYKRAAFGKWHLTGEPTDPADLGALAAAYMHPIDQGFQKFVGCVGNVENHYVWKRVNSDSTGAHPTTEDLGSPLGPFDVSTFNASVVRQAASDWINATSEPFFAYVCLNAPHAPYQVPPQDRVSPSTWSTIEGTLNPTTGLPCAPGDDLTETALIRTAYDWLIEAADQEIGLLVNGIPEAKRANTTIFIVGDNGTPNRVIMEPYQFTHAKGTVYEQGTRVPLITKGRGVSSSGASCSGLINTVDVWRTIAAVTGAQLPTVPGFVHDGVNFSSMMENPLAVSLRSAAFVQFYLPTNVYTPDVDAQPLGVTNHCRAMTDGTLKYVRRRIGTVLFEEAYNLSSNPLETINLWPPSRPYDANEQKLIDLRNSMLLFSGL